MDINKNLSEFNKRFDFIEDSSYEEEFKKFKARVLNILKYIDRYTSAEGIRLFCQILGIPEKWNSPPYGESYSENIINSLLKEDNEKKFYRLLQIIFSFLPIEISRFTSREKLIYQISQAIELSNINLSITVKKEEVIFYPKGETTLDNR